MMIVGEAPGKEEDAQGRPFTGPAGRLMDRIWESVGLSTKDWYITNIVKCRPIAQKGSGRENFTPKNIQRTKCRPYFEAEILLMRPKIIVPLGATATATVLKQSKVTIGAVRGRRTEMTYHIKPAFMSSDGEERWLLYGPSPIVFPMLHPAAILHTKRNPIKYREYRTLMWQDIQELKRILEEEGLI